MEEVKLICCGSILTLLLGVLLLMVIPGPEEQPAQEPFGISTPVWIGEPGQEKLLLDYLTEFQIEKMCHHLIKTKGEFRLQEFKAILGDTNWRRVKADMKAQGLMMRRKNRTTALTHKGWQFVSDALNPQTHKRQQTRGGGVVEQ